MGAAAGDARGLHFCCGGAARNLRFRSEGSAHINVTQTLALIERLLAHGIYVLFLSTNQVFDGETPHVASEAPYAPGQRVWPAEGAHRSGAARPFGARRAGSDPAAVESRITRHAAGPRLGRRARAGQAGARFPRHDARAGADRNDRRGDRGPPERTRQRNLSAHRPARRLLRGGRPPCRPLARRGTANWSPRPARPRPACRKARRHATPRSNSSRLTQRYGLNPPDVWTVIETVVATAGRCDTNNGISHAAGAVLRS